MCVKIGDKGELFQYPCGKCIECRLKKSIEWSYRICNELSLYDENMMITLTYNDDNLPKDGKIRYRDVQLFIKRLRKFFGSRSLRYFACAEYGKKRLRPHYHIIIFGKMFDDLYFFKKDHKGTFLYRSPRLEKLWIFGFSSVITDITQDVAIYCAKYLQKDSPNGDKPFCRMSLKPGIGAGFLKDDKINSILYSDKIYLNGHYIKTPRYYLNYISRLGDDCANGVNLIRFSRTKALMDYMDGKDYSFLLGEVLRKRKKYEKKFQKPLDNDGMI